MRATCSATIACYRYRYQSLYQLHFLFALINQTHGCLTPTQANTHTTTYKTRTADIQPLPHFTSLSSSITATHNKPNPRHACLHRQNALSKLCVRANARAPNGELLKKRERERGRGRVKAPWQDYETHITTNREYGNTKLN